MILFSVLIEIVSGWYLVKLLFRFVEEAKRRLKVAGYEQIYEREDWNLEAGNKYFFTRNYSTIVAFAIGKKYVFLKYTT